MNTFLKNLLWLLAGEGVARVTRIFTAVVLSRYLTPVEFGVAALVLSIDELVRMMTRNGIGQKIIQCSEQQLDAVCQRSYQVNWYIHIALFVLLMVIAKPLATAFSQPELQSFLMLLSLVYLIYPLAMVQVNLVQREQRMKTTASIFGAQVGIDNLLTAILALSGLGVWSILIPKLVVAPLWVCLYYKSHSWRSNSSKPKVSMSVLTEYALPVFLVEAFKSVRMNLDKLLIGILLGVEALGLYYFAVNAGSGLSLALIKAFSTAVLPDLSQQGRLQNGLVWLSVYRQALLKFCCIIVPIIVLQLILSPIYVPVVFGSQWTHAVPILMLLCGATIFHGFIEIGSQVLRAIPDTKKDILLNALFTVSTFSVITVTALWLTQTDSQLLYIVSAMLVSAIVFSILHFVTVSRVAKNTLKTIPEHDLPNKYAAMN